MNARVDLKTAQRHAPQELRPGGTPQNSLQQVILVTLREIGLRPAFAMISYTSFFKAIRYSWNVTFVLDLHQGNATYFKKSVHGNIIELAALAVVSSYV